MKTDTSPIIGILDAPLPEQDFVEGSAAEVAYLREADQQLQRDAVDSLLSEMVTNMEIRERLLRVFDQKIREAHGEKVEPRVNVDFSKIDWIKRDDAEEIPAKLIESPGLTYHLVDLTGFNNSTKKAVAALDQQTASGGQKVLPKLVASLTSTGLPQLEAGIRSGGKKLRPLSRHGVVGASYAGTDYPCYKINVQGTNNRALVLRLSGGEVPAYGVAALFDHDDDQMVYRGLEK